MAEQFRKLKVQYIFQRRACQKYALTSEIRLVGKWLEDSGFKYGEVIIIKVERNKLTIKVAKSGEGK